MPALGSGEDGHREDLRRRYAQALRWHVETGDEGPLAEAWNLARELLSAGKGLTALTSLHEEALREMPLSREARTRAVEFLAEAMGPFEMMLRGYRETAETLRSQHQELLRANSELARQHAVISQQRDALVEAERKQHEINAFVVHDLKNPLAVVQVNLQYVISEPTAPDAVEALQDALSSTQRLGAMVANLLDVYRGGEGRLTPRLITLDAAQLLSEIERRLSRRARQEEQQLTVDAPANLLLRADRDLVHRVLENLADNAAKHTPRRGAIRLSARPDGGGVLIEVCDSGRGIPEAQRATIFDKFVQLAPEGAPRASHGLGLPFCKLVAEAHGGRIWVDSAPEGGCAFRLWLPLRTEPVEGEK